MLYDTVTELRFKVTRSNGENGAWGSVVVKALRY